MTNVLLVSEDRELAKLLKEALHETGGRLTSVCTDGKSTLETFQQTAPGLVVVDSFLPETTGYEMLQALKRANEKCLFMMLSRLRTRSSIERAFRMGAHDVLLLPVSKEVLHDTLLHRLEATAAIEPEEGKATRRK